jgi:uncharacterized protein YegP (UPF0339 family)
MDKVTVYVRSDGKWDWHRKSENGRIVSSSHNQGYENAIDAHEIAEQVNGGEWEFTEDAVQPE